MPEYDFKRSGKRDSRDSLSPQMPRKRGAKKGSTSSEGLAGRPPGSHSKLGQQGSQVTDNRTVFFLPGLKVRVSPTF